MVVALVWFGILMGVGILSRVLVAVVLLLLIDEEEARGVWVRKDVRG